MKDHRIAIIGAGKVGTAVGHLLREKGLDVVAIACRTRESVEKALPFTGGLGFTDAVSAAKLADLIIITTADKDIEKTCQQIAQEDGFELGDKVFHMSGALSVKALAPAAKKGAKTGCLHPIQSFATVEGAIKNLPGTIFGVTVDQPMFKLAEEIVETLGGYPVKIKDEDKVIYHAAAVMVCNYLVGLFYAGQELYQKIGIPPETARQAFLPLLKGSLANLETVGAPAALTGPISRGDLETVRRHLEAIKDVLPVEYELYRMLGHYTVKVALAKGTIEGQAADEMKKLLGSDG